MVRMIRLPLLILVATVGCATLPPMPPVATLLPDSPKEYRWSPFKWKPGVTLTYNERDYWEVKVRDRQTSDHLFRRVFQLRGMESTVRGNVRVQLSTDGTDLGFLLVDEAGRFVDAVASRPEFGEFFKAFVQFGGRPPLGHKVEVLKVGESYRVEHPSSIGVGDWPQAWRDSFKETIVLNYEFVGYARLGEKMVVGFRFEMPNVLWSTVRVADIGEINTLAGSGIQYYDAVGGFLVSSYSEYSAMGEIGRPDARLPYVRRKVAVSELDWQKSSGF